MADPDNGNHSDNGKNLSDGKIAESYKAIEEALGGAVQVMARSPLYAGKSIKETHERLLPAIATRQYRLVKNKDGESVGFISWAMISDEAEKRLSDDKESIKLSDWQSGGTGYLVDVAAADLRFCTALVERLKQEVFADKPLKALRVEGGKARLTEVVVGKK